MQLSALDLNLLVALDALLQEGSVERAARRLSLSPSATSHALSRLRELFADPLFVRSGRGLAPTRRAQEVAPALRRLMEGLEAVVRAPGPLDVARLERTFRLLTTDHIELVLMPELEPVIRTEAPRVALHSRPVGAGAVDELRSGGADLAFGVFTQLPDDVACEALFRDHFVVVLRKGHPALKGPLTLEAFVELEHVQIAPRGRPGGPVDDALAQRGHGRRIARTFASFLPALFLVARSDYGLTLSARLGSTLAETLGLALVAHPLPLEPYTLSQAWHRRSEADAAHAWIRERAKAAAARLPAPKRVRGVRRG